jgi:hypothetical protein
MFSEKTDPEYQEALALIRAGEESLANRPEADEPGFQANVRDLWREQKYLARDQMEQRSRVAIRQGAKVYDKNPKR